MAKYISVNALDAALNYIKNNADQISICSAEPTTYDMAVTLGEYRLSIKTGLTPDIFEGPEDCLTGGRQLKVPAFDTMGIAEAGTATYVVLSNQANEELIYVTTCTPQELTMGRTSATSIWYISISNPT